MGLNTYVSLRSLPYVDSRVVIINCSTKWVTSLAVLSAHRYLDLPIVVIDCESTDGSKEFLSRIADDLRLSVDCVDWPLRPHPVALDDVLMQIPSDKVVLMDSDLEVRSPTAFHEMTKALARNPHAYGSGFRHGPAWLGPENGVPAYTGYYVERMWIPFVYLRTAPLREALATGASFRNRRTYHEIPNAPRLSRFLSLRYRIAGLRHIPIPTLGKHRPRYEGRFPKFVEYDTGADLHAHLLESQWDFVAIAPDFWGGVMHHHGVTRSSRMSRALRLAKRIKFVTPGTETEQSSIQHAVMQRLVEAYGVRA